MMLLIDAGNTRIKWRLLDPSVADQGAFGHDQVDQLGTVLARNPAIHRIVGANVAGPNIAAAIAQLALHHGLVPEWLSSSPMRCGVRNLYEHPEQLGTDRWAALIGARARHPHACLVVMAGTATTVDVLDTAGDFRGGLILPGVETMQRALATNTAQLPYANGHYRDIPRNTADAIRSGCLHAQAGAVERMFRQIENIPHACCLLGGGAADTFADLLSVPVQRIDNLVLDGLAQIAQEH